MNNIDLDGFERYCKNIYFIKSINAYKGYLEKGLQILSQISSGSIEDFVDSKDRDRNYLKEEFTRQIEIDKLHSDLYADFSSAAKKYMEFKHQKYPLSKEQISKKYDQIFQTINDSGTIKIKTQNGSPFNLEINSTSLCVRGTDGNGQECMSISKEKIMRTLFQNEPYTYSSYEPSVINFIFGLNDKYEYKQIVESLYKQLMDIDNLPYMNYPGENYIQFQIYQKFGIHMELWLIDKDEKMYLDIHQEKRSNDFNDQFIQFVQKIIGQNNKYKIVTREKSKDTKIVRQTKIYPKNEILNRIDEIAEDIREMNDLFRSPILSHFNPNNNDFKNEKYNMNTKQPLNQILYGPPGTGKTYNTINKALEIIFEKDDENKVFTITSENDNTYDIKYIDAYTNKNREALTAIFDLYVKSGQIVFTTFHQSYGYEEFVEGIKAETIGTQVIYKIESGIFKKIAEEANSKAVVSTYELNNLDNTIVWKMSLGDSQTGEDKLYYEEAIETDSIIMGYGDTIDFTICNDKNSIQQLTSDSTTVNMMHRFKNEMKNGDIVIISDGNRKFKAIVQVDGDYFYDTDSNYRQKRKIKWLKRFTTSRSYEEISDRYFTQVTLNQPRGIDRKKLLTYLKDEKAIDNTFKNYVHIIDEINRGNISKIFGELITLIEPSKRIGAEEEIRVSLPYSGMEFDSGKGFGVPQNLYIIGTMNTADRSIALMDTALRRRFHFEERMPDLNTLEEMKDVQGINVQTMLEMINKRIEYLYDRDHQIGHAYFMSLTGKDGDEAKMELDNIFRNKIIPLLQEYFYDDWEKIQMVLGDHYDQINSRSNNKQSSGNDENNFDSDINKNRFIQSYIANETDIIGFNHDDIEDTQRKYRVNPTKPFPLEAYLGITNFSKKKSSTENAQDNAEQTDSH